MITNNSDFSKYIVNLELGYLDHLAQILYLKVNIPIIDSICINKRYFTVANIAEFKYLLQEDLWNNVLLLNDVNISFRAFIYMFWYYFFNRAFPDKTSYRRNEFENK